MLAAAGIVVTEIRTPISAPDLAVDRDSIPAAPAHRATITVKASGLAIRFAIWWSAVSNSSVVRPVAFASSVAR